MKQTIIATDLTAKVKIRRKRLLAMLIDWYISSMLASIPVTFYFRKGEMVSQGSFLLSNYDRQSGLIIGSIAILVGIVYFFVIPTFIINGQTIGKKIMGIKVVAKNGSPVSLTTMVKRELIVVFIEGGIVITSGYLRQFIQLFITVPIIDNWTYLAYGVTLVSILFAYMHPKTAMFHDVFAQTEVVGMHSSPL